LSYQSNSIFFSYSCGSFACNDFWISERDQRQRNACGRRGYFDVQNFGTVRLADIDCPEIGAQGGPEAKVYTASLLQNRVVYLDVDNTTGKDSYGRYVCVAYLANPDGSINIYQNINRILVNGGHACIWDFSNNEFNPADWWGGQIPSTACIKGSDESPTPVPVVNDGPFVGSIKSDKYHYTSCSAAKKIKPANEIWFSSSDDARSQGYVPCGICYPP
jgi:micrococcal nuclease